MNEFDRNVKKILEFEKIFLKGGLRYTPIKVFVVNFQFDWKMLYDLYSYKDAAFYVLRKCHHPLAGEALNIAAAELHVSISREWDHPPLLFSHYHVLKSRLEEVIGSDAKENEYIALCSFIITAIIKIRDRYEGKTL